jgi:pimeloyl-ACP methyl ester carboxylesterase
VPGLAVTTTVETMQTMLPVGADKIWAEDSGGSGPVLVLLHEGVGDSRMWDPIWADLTAAGRVIRYDVRGFGRSAAATENFTLLGDLVAVLDEFEVRSAHVVGCSMGGGTALELTLADPHRVRSVVLLAPGIGGYPYPETPELDAACDVLESAGDTEGIVRLLLDVWGRSGADQLVTDLMRSALRAWAGEEEFEQEGDPTFDRLGEVHTPTVLMVGDQDDAALIASNEEAAARIPGCELIRMSGVDHYPTIRAPRLVTDAILRHIAAHP